MMKRLARLALMSGVLTASSAFAQTLPGDPVMGRQLAQQVCSNCHFVNKGEYGLKVPGPPAFQELADNSEINSISLRILLQTPHRDMPDLILSPSEMDAVISYILTLK